MLNDVFNFFSNSPLSLRIFFILLSVLGLLVLYIVVTIFYHISLLIIKGFTQENFGKIKNYLLTPKNFRKTYEELSDTLDVFNKHRYKDTENCSKCLEYQKELNKQLSKLRSILGCLDPREAKKYTTHIKQYELILHTLYLISRDEYLLLTLYQDQQALSFFSSECKKLNNGF